MYYDSAAYSVSFTAQQPYYATATYSVYDSVTFKAIKFYCVDSYYLIMSVGWSQRGWYAYNIKHKHFYSKIKCIISKK